MKRVVLVAQSPRLLWALHRQFRQLKGLRIAGMIDARRSVGDVIAVMRPDLVVVDAPPGPKVNQLIAEVAAATQAAIVVALTGCEDLAWTNGLLAAGADVLISRSTELSVMGTLLGEIAAGRLVQASRAQPEQCSAIPALTPRELEILALLEAGCKNQEIADRLTVTIQTVKFHLANLYRKLGVANRTEASHFAHRHGLLSDGRTRQFAGIA